MAATKAAEVAKEKFSDQELTLTKHSGKLMVLVNFLAALWKSSPRERVVLVSAFTNTLNMLEEVYLAHLPRNRIATTIIVIS